MMPDGGFSVDTDTQTSLDELVRWGYLAQKVKDQKTSYLLTTGGLRYAAHENEPPWNGNDRRRTRRPPYGVEPRVRTLK